MLHKLLFTSLIGAAGVCSLSASTITFTTAAAAVDTVGEPVSASASVTTGDGTVSVVLTDLTTNILSAGQLLSDFFFTLGNSFTLSGSSVTPSGVSLITVASNGAITADGTSAVPWTLTACSAVTTTSSTCTGTGSTIHLDSLAGSGGSETIIGRAAGQTSYPNANSSIAGNPAHNPFISSTATFNFAVTGVTAATTITAASFSFGTTANNNVPGVPGGGGGGGGSTTPEPGTLLLSLGGAGLVAFRSFRGK